MIGRWAETIVGVGQTANIRKLEGEVKKYRCEESDQT